MKETEVHSMILEKTDDIEDDDLRNFINDILRFERSKLDRENYQFSDRYTSLIDDYTMNGSLDEYNDE